MKNFIAFIKADKYTFMAAACLLLAGIIYQVVTDRNSEEALKNSRFIEGKITSILPGRGLSTVYVEFLFGNRTIDDDFAVQVDTFKTGDKVLLQVSNEHPDKYLKYIKKLD